MSRSPLPSMRVASAPARTRNAEVSPGPRLEYTSIDIRDLSAERQKLHVNWDAVTGIATVLGVSAAGWALIGLGISVFLK
ncbi:MAG: hypothetical protein JOY93_06125 [Acidobacteriales bacterium]|nr:hypothetical protein [Terriglobales bacterium]